VRARPHPEYYSLAVSVHFQIMPPNDDWTDDLRPRRDDVVTNRQKFRNLRFQIIDNSI
jgi:hypothetical protein